MYKIIVFIYIIFVIIQIISVIIKKRNIDKEKKENEKLILKERTEKIDAFLKKQILEKYDFIIKNKLNYKQFIEFIKKNEIINYNNEKFYFFIFEKGKKTDEGKDYITKLHANKDYINLPWGDIIYKVKDTQYFTALHPNNDLIKNMHNITKNKNNNNYVGNLEYYWVDPLTGNITRKRTLFKQFNIEGHEGIFAIGYTLKNLNYDHFMYFDLINKILLVITSIITVLLPLIFTKIFGKIGFVIGLIFIIFFNIYILLFLTQTTPIFKIDYTNEIANSFSLKILSIAFLGSVNIFILNFLKSNNYKFFLVNIFIFLCSIMFLIISILNKSLLVPLDFTKDVIENHFSYNLVIYLIIFIFINFLAFMGWKNKIF